MTALTTQAQAEAALKSMQRKLKDWLKFRTTLDSYVAGKKPGAPAWLRNPGVRPIPPGVVSQTLRKDRFAAEQDLANTLFSLLTETGLDPATLPQPNVTVDPDAAVSLARIVVSGKTPSEAAAPQAQGVAWFVLAIPIGGLVLVLTQLIKSKADQAMESERLRCIESGACTDSGFWLKVASVAVVGWIAWEKLGLKHKLKVT